MSDTTPVTSMTAEDDDGLAFACRLDGKGGATLVGWDEVEAWKPGDDPIWAHVNLDAPRAADWLSRQEDIPAIARQALLAEETRPRVFTQGKGVVAILRGVNLNAGADPNDMVAIRIWTDKNRVITVRQTRLHTPRDILANLTERGTGPHSPTLLFVRLAERLIERMNSVIVHLDEQLDDIEERLETSDHGILRRELTGVRQACVGLRRYLGPQREALARLHTDPPVWLETEHVLNLRETADRLQRYLEDLDAARDRAVVIRDEISNRLSENMNRTMYVLSIVASIFLPLGFLTGLLGINVGGMPGVNSASAFWITSGLMVLVLILEVVLLRRMKWI